MNERKSILMNSKFIDELSMMIENAMNDNLKGNKILGVSIVDTHDPYPPHSNRFVGVIFYEDSDT